MLLSASLPGPVTPATFPWIAPGHGRPGKASGDSLGKLLIPLKYTRFGSSDLTAEIQDTAGKDPQEVVLELTGPAVTFN